MPQANLRDLATMRSFIDLLNAVLSLTHLNKTVPPPLYSDGTQCRPSKSEGAPMLDTYIGHIFFYITLKGSLSDRVDNEGDGTMAELDGEE